MASAEAGIAVLDRFRRTGSVIDGDAIDWQKYMTPEERSRVVPIEALMEKAKARMLLGPDDDDGLTLPWEKTQGKVIIKPGKLAIWAGWTHHGKTQMLKQLMLHGISKSEKVLIASMEEEIGEVVEGLAYIACGTQEPKASDIDRFHQFAQGKLWLYDQQGVVNVRRIAAVIRYAAAELKITQAVVDSLMMLAVDRDDYEAQAKFVGELKSIAKDTQTTIHLVAHMRKRDGKSGDETPGTIHDIAGGHEIASKSDYVFIPWRDKKPGANPQCLLKVDKQRGRKSWIGIIGLNFHTQARQFIEDVHPMRFWNEQEQEF